MGFNFINLLKRKLNLSLIKMENISIMSYIEDPPSNPIDLFQTILADKQKYQPDPFITMNLATINKKYSILNRTVVYRGLSVNKDGFIFVTENNSQKYFDIKSNPKIASTFLFMYIKNEVPIVKQIRINGTAQELSEEEISNLWKEERPFAKIRSILSDCGKNVNWNELKLKHDELLKAYQDGKESLNQTKTFTAFCILPETVDFYYVAGSNSIADRVVYRKEDDGWCNEHVYP